MASAAPSTIRYGVAVRYPFGTGLVAMTHAPSAMRWSLLRRLLPVAVPDVIDRAQQSDERQPEDECQTEGRREGRGRQNRSHERCTEQSRKGEASHANAQRWLAGAGVGAAKEIMRDEDHQPGEHGAEGRDGHHQRER